MYHTVTSTSTFSVTTHDAVCLIFASLRFRRCKEYNDIRRFEFVLFFFLVHLTIPNLFSQCCLCTGSVQVHREVEASSLATDASLYSYIFEQWKILRSQLHGWLCVVWCPISLQKFRGTLWYLRWPSWKTGNTTITFQHNVWLCIVPETHFLKEEGLFVAAPLVWLWGYLSMCYYYLFYYGKESMKWSLMFLFLKYSHLLLKMYISILRIFIKSHSAVVFSVGEWHFSCSYVNIWLTAGTVYFGSQFERLKSTKLERAWWQVAPGRQEHAAETPDFTSRQSKKLSIGSEWGWGCVASRVIPSDLLPMVELLFLKGRQPSKQSDQQETTQSNAYT